MEENDGHTNNDKAIRHVKNGIVNQAKIKHINDFPFDGSVNKISKGSA